MLKASARTSAAVTSTTRLSVFIVIPSLKLYGRGLRHLQVEHLLRVVLEDQFLVRVAEPFDRFDGEPRLVEPAAGARVEHRADARPLRAEQAPVDANGL